MEVSRCDSLCREGRTSPPSARVLPTEVNPSWLGKPSAWWIPSRSPGGTWQTWVSSPSQCGRASILCRAWAPAAPGWCWSRSTRPGRRAAARPGISRTTTARLLRVPPGEPLRPRLAWWWGPVEFQPNRTWPSTSPRWDACCRAHPEIIDQLRASGGWRRLRACSAVMKWSGAGSDSDPGGRALLRPSFTRKHTN